MNISDSKNKNYQKYFNFSSNGEKTLKKIISVDEIKKVYDGRLRETLLSSHIDYFLLNNNYSELTKYVTNSPDDAGKNRDLIKVATELTKKQEFNFAENILYKLDDLWTSRGFIACAETLNKQGNYLLAIKYAKKADKLSKGEFRDAFSQYILNINDLASYYQKQNNLSGIEKLIKVLESNQNRSNQLDRNIIVETKQKLKILLDSEIKKQDSSNLEKLKNIENTLCVNSIKKFFSNREKIKRMITLNFKKLDTSTQSNIVSSLNEIINSYSPKYKKQATSLLTAINSKTLNQSRNTFISFA
jgi:tetratricopeptide (TPR) repeat protein